MEKESLLAIKKMLKEELEPIKSDISSIKSTLDEHTRILNEHTKKLDEHTRILDEHTKKLDEHTQILRALEHSAQVNKAEHDSIMNDIAHIKGEIENLRKDMTNVELITASNWADIAKLKSVK
ncbi:hypothetical protein SAMN02745135_01720 [Caloranaerobacter azorensis DSM 13643]|uniref:Uncharacterized protein n=1 Tax=Caloranaerobacter azorensis DSM 13643 TaxID=1121264 RepID=A0A1M5V3J4_9FIRM|nr:hypothetical protein [Caloranaerobacter azorensis]SHH69795.1 hypothetical protein SAMN02745135_01720 [Caloranaerobacter azorensis DSM 13643]